MKEPLSYKEELITLVAHYGKKYELSKEVGPDYYEPGMMENLDQYFGAYDEATRRLTIKCEAKGLRYDNRTTNLEQVSVGDQVRIVRERNNAFNSNNFEITTIGNASLGYLPADLCNALAPLYDAGCADIISTRISYIERISQRSRYARQGVLFIEIVIKFKGL